MTAAVVDQLRAGIALHEAGRLAEAESAYARALEREPESGDAWHLMARAALDRKDHLTAMARAVRAIRLFPAAPAFHNTLGEILEAQGKRQQARACFQEALRLDSSFVPALLNLGNALQAEGDLEGASIIYGKAIETRPDCAEAFTNLGNALRAQGRHADALECYREAVRLRPENAEASINLAAGLLQARDFAEAERFARRAVELRPELAEGHSNLAIALLNRGRLHEAEAAARSAIELRPAAAHLHANLASILLKQRRPADAEQSCRHALELRPRYAEAANNLGLALQTQDRLEEAAEALGNALEWGSGSAEIWTNLGTVRESQAGPEDALACYDRALAIDAGFPKAHFCRSLMLLRGGRLEEGFAEYEWRWKARKERPRAQVLPAWDGSPAPGKTILLYAEQGLGDTIQFARFARMAADRCARVILECQLAIAKLAASFEGVAEVITTDTPLPRCDMQAALMSLPHLLHAAPESEPYLSVRGRPPGDGPRLPRIGLAWAGNPQHAADRHRSIPLETLAPLGCIRELEWFSLHKGTTAAPWLRQPLSDASGLEELADLMCGLDLIITIDSMPAHLAGALGRPVWVMLAHVADWRWQTGREDSPWYPTMRLFRQERRGCWDGVVESIAAELRQFSVQGLWHEADMRK